MEYIYRLELDQCSHLAFLETNESFWAVELATAREHNLPKVREALLYFWFLAKRLH